MFNTLAEQCPGFNSTKPVKRLRRGERQEGLQRGESFCNICKQWKRLDEFGPSCLSYCMLCKREYEKQRHIRRFGPHKNDYGPGKAERQQKAKEGIYWCNTCKQWKDRSDFSNNKKMSGGRNHFCKDCQKLKAQKDKDKPSYKYSHYKSGAERRNIVFNLTFEEFMSFWQQPCHYCGNQIATVGIDRKYNSQGYNIENCVPCCTSCNTKLKWGYDYDVFLEYITRVYNHCIKSSK